MESASAQDAGCVWPRTYSCSMKELHQRERDQLCELLNTGRLGQALFTLVLWGCENDTERPEGQRQPRLVSWQQMHAVSVPGHPADLDAENVLDWAGCAVIDFINALERAVDDRWVSLRESVVKVVAGDGREGYILRQRRPVASTRALRRPHSWASTLTLLQVVLCVQGRCVVELVGADASLDGFLAAHMDRPTGYLVHFSPAFRLVVEERAGALRVVAVGDYVGHERQALEHLLHAGDVTFMVFPECTMPRAVRRSVARTIAGTARAPLLTVAGSFHDDQSDSPTAPALNVSELLDPFGQTLIRHVKTSTATLRGPGRQSLPEHIELHNTHHALVCSIGLIGLSICMEFSEVDGSAYSAWSAMAPDWMLVPSMGGSSTVDMHLGVARTLWDSHRTVSLIANQSTTDAEEPGAIVKREQVRGPSAVNQRIALSRNGK